MLTEKVERRWEVSISSNGMGTAAERFTINSVDGDPKSAKVTVMGHGALLVSLADLADALVKVSRHQAKNAEE
jgi:hypothetical protein